MTSEKLRLFQQRLEALQWELLAAKDAAQDSTKPVALDQASVGRLSRMDAMQSQAMAIETQRRRDIHLQRVREALARVQADEYGICPVCDE
ncbi:MAG: TraR/DksA family transcriptional regulator, partial [Pseudomonadota bacterium]